MAYISNSVGNGGQNLAADVKAIQWMLNRAQSNYSNVIFRLCYILNETGVLDTSTESAIKDLIEYRKKVTPNAEIAVLAKPIGGNTLETTKIFTKTFIAPNDDDYKYLLKCTLKPVCLTPNRQARLNFHSDSLVAQALAGRIGFEQFKKAAIAMDDDTCGGSNPLGTNMIGINPVTRKPGINAVSSGKLGELRSGVRGNGNYKGRTNNKHDAIDIRAPVGTPIYAFLDGVVEQLTTTGGMGNRVILKHKGGIYSHYAHLKSFAAGIKITTPRMKIKQGHLIGYAGRTGNAGGLQPNSEDHVHFAISTYVRPPARSSHWKNPVRYLNDGVLTTKKGDKNGKIF